MNRTDVAYRAGAPTFARIAYGIRGPKVAILGCEFAGTVLEPGDSDSTFAVGDKVFGYVEGPFGAHVQPLVVPQRGSVAKIPTGLPFEVAAAGTEGSHYALGMIRVRRPSRRRRARQRSVRRDRLGRRPAVASSAQR